MAETCPTMQVKQKSDGEVVTINVTDFNEEHYERVAPPRKALKDDGAGKKDDGKKDDGKKDDK